MLNGVSILYVEFQGDTFLVCELHSKSNNEKYPRKLLCEGSMNIHCSSICSHGGHWFIGFLITDFANAFDLAL